MKISNLGLFPAAYLGMVLLATSASAAVITLPSDLNPGDQFRVVFVTSQVRDALSPDINDYNSFVDTVAGMLSLDGATDLEWRAIASTPTVAARDNTGTNFDGGFPVYRVDGVRVASDNLDLWDGDLLAPIDRTERGERRGSQVWTGSTDFGASHPSFPLGLPANNLSMIGFSGGTDETWVQWDTALNFVNRFGITPKEFYAISETITVPAPPGVPEPSSALLLAFAAGIGGVLYRRKRKSLELHPAP